jgi:small subunit ribosomal protein S13
MASVLQIGGHTLKASARLVYALPAIYGIGPTSAKQLCAEMGFPPGVRVANLAEKQKAQLVSKILNERVTEGALRQATEINIRKQIRNNTWRGMRLAAGLPVNGQRTSTNHKTAARLRHGALVEQQKMAAPELRKGKVPAKKAPTAAATKKK